MRRQHALYGYLSAGCTQRPRSSELAFVNRRHHRNPQLSAPSARFPRRLSFQRPPEHHQAASGASAPLRRLRTWNLYSCRPSGRLLLPPLVLFQVHLISSPPFYRLATSVLKSATPPPPRCYLRPSVLMLSDTATRRHHAHFP